MRWELIVPDVVVADAILAKALLVLMILMLMSDHARELPALLGQAELPSRVELQAEQSS